MLRHRDGRFMLGERKPAHEYLKRCEAARRGWVTRKRNAKFFAEELSRQFEFWPKEQLSNQRRPG